MREMDMQKTYIWRPWRQMQNFRTQFLGLIATGILAKLHPIAWSCMFSYKFLQYFKNTFFRTPVCDGFFKFN